jgi:hypothetical protein
MRWVDDPLCQPQTVALGRAIQYVKLGYRGSFSGKLSPEMSNPEDQAPSPLPLPAENALVETLQASPPSVAVDAPPEIGGRDGPDPTRFGDWELRGRCIDF